jgi:hypothetical protein
VVQQVVCNPAGWSYSRDQAVAIQRQRDEAGRLDPALDPLALLIRHKEKELAELRRKAEQAQGS